jgi:hypothetical protein
MTRQEVVDTLLDKILEADWHYLSYHFSPYKEGYEHFLGASIVDSCTRIEAVIPGYTEEFATKLSSFSNREKYQPHYEQIIQLLAELYVINHLATIKFPSASFLHEPTSSDSNKNPEVGIILNDKEIYVEVKCREYIPHHNNRGDASIEVPARMDGIKEVAELMLKDGEHIGYPRDNTIMDFLISANEKFSGFKKDSSKSITVLVIVWDDVIYEPISSLLNRSSGLLTDNSFYKNGGEVVKFENVDAILLVRQSHHIVRATRDQFPVDGLNHPLDWGAKNMVLPKAYIPVNTTHEVDEYLCQILEAHNISELTHVAEYRPQELVFHV